MPRDEFTEPTKRLLAERAAYVCCNPDCKRSTLGASMADEEKSIKSGVAGHITAAARNGPRYNPNLTSEERASASNGVWLCGTCSMMIDKNGGTDFPESVLRTWKEEHELRTFESLKSGSSDIGLTGWCEEDAGNWKLYVKNPTLVPFIDCVVRGYKVEHAGNEFSDIEIVFGTVPPKQTQSDEIDYDTLQSDVFGHPLVEIEYTDTEGRHWIRNYTGKIEEIEFRRPFD